MLAQIAAYDLPDIQSAFGSEYLCNFNDFQQNLAVGRKEGKIRPPPCQHGQNNDARLQNI